MKLRMNYKTCDDKELWECCQSQNDEKAYSEIFRRYSPLLLRIVSPRIDNSMIAEELVMDGFFKLWDKRARIIDGNFLNYLFTCVYNSVASHLRKELPVIVDLTEIEDISINYSYSADSNLLSEEITEVYHTALEKLSPRRREVFLLSRNENLSYAEIAQKMNVSVSAVDNYMRAALDTLRHNMKECISALLFLFMHFF